MTKLRIQLLGEPRVYMPDGVEVRLPTRKALALLAYLSSPPGVSHSRDDLAAFLWSRSPQDQARSNLRQNLARLRKALGPARDVIAADAHRIGIEAGAVEIDVAALEEFAGHADAKDLQSAAALIGGEFAAGFHLNEDPFEEWIRGERRRVAEIAAATLYRLLDHHEAQADHDNAALIACKLLAIDPLQERAHQSYMRALAAQDRFESALQQYKSCRDMLRRELGVDPSDEIRTLQADIARQRDAKRHLANAPAVETSDLVRVMNGKAPVGPGLSQDLPPQLQGLDLSVPERPSIVIMPFRNLTGDEAQNHLAEGIRIDIQAALIKITGIFLIAVGTGNALREQDATAVGENLRVRFVLQGSVRSAGNKLRISVELIDTQAGNAIWTESYDRQFDDEFEVQDEIIGEVITALDVKLLSGEQAAVWHKTLKDRDALEAFYKGTENFFKLQKDTNARARRYFQVAHRKQPDVSIGSTWTAMTHWFDAFKAWRRNPAKCLDEAEKWSEIAVAMEDADGQAHMVLSHVHLMKRRFDDALLVGREAVRLRPNCANANGFFANVLHYCGEQADAIEHVTWAMRYSPVYPPFFADVLSLALQLSDETDAAMAVAGESLRINPAGVTARLVLINGHAEKGDFAAAREVGVRMTAQDPAFSLRAFAERQPYRNAGDLEKFLNGLRQSGLPA